MKRLHMSEEDKTAFCAAFMRARENGMSIRTAYQQARKEMAVAGKRSPGFSTLEYWLRHGRGNEETSPESAEIETPVAADPQEAESNQAQDDVPQKDPEDRLSVYQDLLRAYRFRRECDIDRLTDRLAPELLEDIDA